MPTSIFFLSLFPFSPWAWFPTKAHIIFSLAQVQEPLLPPLYVSIWRGTEAAMAPVHRPLPLALEMFALSTSYQHERSFVLHGEPIQRIKIPL